MIDLGEQWDRPEPVPPRRPWRHGRPRRPAPRMAIVVAAALALLAGGGAPPVYGLRRLFTVPSSINDDLSMTGDRLYLVHTGSARAYRLPDGKLLWSVHTPEPIDVAVPVPDSGVVLTETVSDAHARVVALDADTGQVLWRVAAASLTDVLAAQRRGVLFLGEEDGTGEVRGVELRTGAVIWRRTIGRDATFVQIGSTAPGRPAVMIFQDATGQTEVVAEATGQVLARARLVVPTAPGPTGRPMVVPPAAIGGRMYLARPGTGTVRVDAYDLATLRPLWHATVAADAFEATDCGPVVCLGGYQHLVGVDPATGRVRWRSDQWSSGAPLGADRLLVANGNPDAPLFAVVDGTDLRHPVDLAGWLPVAGSPTTDLVARNDSGLRVWFAALGDPLTGLRPLGWIHGVLADSCQTRQRYLACPTVADEVAVWRYQP